ncbi:MAG: trypsin-like peptidase domain-containing protein [Candidatus Brennerbacteria bacterium]|nr:trypsin-like peptidase domain-containing protein [Candidatus Brennerbacteria bacterium]
MPTARQAPLLAGQANLFQDFLNRFLPKFGSGKLNEDFGQNNEVKLEEPTSLYKPALDYEQAVIGAVEKASPAVVSIIISKDLPVIEQCPFNPFGDLPPEFNQFFDFGPFQQFNQPCSKGKTKHQEVGGGSGFIVSADGLIVTNKHVVADEAAEYTVLTNDGKKYDAKVLARDPSLDLAVLKIKTSNLPVVALGNSDTIKLGQTAIAIGNALGEFRNTVSVGVISGLARTVTASGGGMSETIEGVIQTDAAINPGNSGGPILNLRGEVIGINTAIASGAENIGFAIPINQAKRAINSVQKSGRIISAYLGVRYIHLSPEVSEKQKLPVKYGALVRGNDQGPGVLPNSPAAKAGIQAEDIILEVNGQQIDQDHTLASFVQKYSVGDVLNLKIQRGDKVLNLKTVLEERPEM